MALRTADGTARGMVDSFLLDQKLPLRPKLMLLHPPRLGQTLCRHYGQTLCRLFAAKLYVG
jgi:hypothetical protein